MKTVGETIRIHRISAGMTQGELALKLGVSTSTVGMYEQGRRAPNNAMILKICRLFDISADNLLGVPEHPCEAADIIKEMTDRIRHNNGVLLNGLPISVEDRNNLLNAIEVAVQVAMSKKRSIKVDSQGNC